MNFLSFVHGKFFFKNNKKTESKKKNKNLTKILVMM